MITSTTLKRAISTVVCSAALAMGATTSDARGAWILRDTDNISRSVGSGRAYTTNGTFTWQEEEAMAYRDERAAFSTKLWISGPRNSCARLRVITYKRYRSDQATSVEISKRFPGANTTTFGYYNFCAPSGSGYTTISGEDIIGNLYDFVRADISICYAPSSTRPATECYNFTVRPGD